MIRLATIGTNFITDWLMEGILELDEIQLTAVYSRNLEKGKQFAAKYNVENLYALCTFDHNDQLRKACAL